jgi:hypothetical protein
MNTSATKKPGAFRLALFGLALAVLFPAGLAAQTVPTAEAGLDYDGRAIVAILPFAGE